MEITVYSKPSCVMCEATYRGLLSKGIDFNLTNVAVDSDSLEYIKSLGYLQAPVVVTSVGHWSGFRPDKINELLQAMLEAGATLNPRGQQEVEAQIKVIKTDMLAATEVAA